ncbi:hypothetical protein EB796_020174 [Bugula neritina]|uniref:Uncharacterized protein n=1 Tax=Bugula neritina TaxID=10212 RepID=A0A7J7J661_BUGNE|nr:hypothetical protein EB796_020174 [Bugula neritina]
MSKGSASYLELDEYPVESKLIGNVSFPIFQPSASKERFLMYEEVVNKYSPTEIQKLEANMSLSLPAGASNQYYYC